MKKMIKEAECEKGCNAQGTPKDISIIIMF